MRIDTSQHMRTSQQMKLAPRMIQSMEVLQMPLMALQERIEQELESNIALELASLAPDADVEVEDDDAEVDRLRERELIVGDGADFERLSEYESSYREAIDNEYVGTTYSPSRHAGERDAKLDAMANTAARSESVAEHLEHQVTFLDVSEPIADAARLLLQFIDEDGFLSLDLDAIYAQSSAVPGVIRDGELTPELLEQALIELQSNLDPPGIAARDQRESLLLQVDRFAADAEDKHDWTDVITLITHHYDDLLQNRLPRIEQETGMSIDRIKAAMVLMKKLNLRPARELIDVEIPPITPDVIVEYEESTDTYVARLADGVLPLLRIAPEAKQIAHDKSLDRQTRDFATDGIRSASWLIDAISQRQNTLLRVVKVVLTRQRDAFDYGRQNLKPLPMTEVADQLGVHVATVSRAVADKWMQTPRGVMPLRGFFSGGATTESGEEMSWDAIKANLKDIVGHEDRKKPFSDEALSRELKKQGIDIARRTVVKYRSQLGIPPARLRKEH